MKLLLTSGGVRNPSIHAALLDLLGKPIADCDALVVPTALYGHPMAGPRQAYRTISGLEDECPMVSLGWKSVGLLELTALPSLAPDAWVPVVSAADVLLVDGGDAAYLCHWLRESGLAELIPSLDSVWVSVSAGSMVLTPRTGMDFVNWHSPAGDTMLGVVDFSIFPHLDVFPTNTMAAAEAWAAELGIPAYAVDDDTAIKVVDGTVEVVSEGTWKLL
jgi:dipeptidase E